MTRPKRKSTKESKPNFVLTLKLDTEIYQEDILDKRLDIGRRIYNACLYELNKRYRLMVESKEYQRAIKLSKRDKSRNERLQELNKKYKLTEYSLHDFVKPMQHHFKNDLDALTVQKIATRCFEAFKGKIYHSAKTIHFKKQGELHSLEGKSNAAGIKFRGNTLIWNGLSIKVLVKAKDDYAKMALLQTIKYCRVVKNGANYYLQLVIEGIPPEKINKDGEFRHKVASSKVGMTKNKRGKINRKKRFGKSLANKAPAMFLTILDNKLKHLGTELHRINTTEVKASQYNHVENSYVKKELNERWTMIGEARIQRDLYSSFLIMNINSDLSSINRNRCLETYEKFKAFHDIEIERLKASTDRKISSMGI